MPVEAQGYHLHNVFSEGRQFEKVHNFPLQQSGVIQQDTLVLGVTGYDADTSAGVIIYALLLIELLDVTSADPHDL